MHSSVWQESSDENSENLLSVKDSVVAWICLFGSRSTA